MTGAGRKKERKETTETVERVWPAMPRTCTRAVFI